MTDKIMIDGVDVSECHCYVDNNKEYSCGEHCSKFHYRYCGDNPNCYYKQLKRKEDLINEIENVIKPYQEEIEADAFSLPSAIKSVLQRKEQECEELKAKLKEKDSELSKKCFELLEKKARIAQLIDENATKEVIYKINGKCAKTTANRVKEITAIVNNKAIIYEQQDQYKQALDEIEEKAKELITHTPEYGNCYFKDQCGEYCPPKRTQKFDICLYQEVDKILDIISKAKGGEE